MSRQFLFKFLFSTLSVVFVVVVILLIVQLTKLQSQDDSSGTGERVTDSLKFVIVLSRHGNRGAHSDYPADPYPINDTQYWPFGNNGLTPVGRKQMYKLGGRVRELYNGFLNSTFHPEELHASSTYMDRMLMSGECFLAGLYPPHSWQLWDSALPWQPTPLYSDSPDKTMLTYYCDRFQVNYKEACEAAIIKYNTNITVLVDTYNSITGSNDSERDGIDDLWSFWDKLISEDTEGYTVPDWTMSLYPEPLLEYMALMYYTFTSANQEMVRLIVGELYDEMLDTMQSVVNGSQTERKVQYYSGHDCSVLALQVLLGVSDDDLVGLVKPGSALTLELHLNQTSSQFYVKVLFIDGGQTDLDYTLMTLPTCGDPCDFNTLVNNTLQYTNVSFWEECQVSSNTSLTRQNLPFTH